MRKLIGLLAIVLLPHLAWGQETGNAKFTTLATVAYGSIGSSFGAALTNTAPLKSISILNTTNCRVILSFDAGTTSHYAMPASSTLTLDLQANGLWHRGSLYVKYDTGETCGLGSLYISGVY